MDERAPRGERRSDDSRVAERDKDNAFDRAQAPDNGQEARRARGSRPFIIALVVLLGIGTVIGTVLWWSQARHFEWTDDAFIDTRIVSISSQVNGLIVDVSVNDNQLSDGGAVLFRIDERDYRAAVDQAKAQVDQAAASIKNLQAQIDAQQPKIDQAEKQVVEAHGALDFARQENTRYQGLLRAGSGSVQRAEQSASDLIQKQAAFDGAQANAIATKKQLEVLKTQQAITQGQLEQAKASEDLANANLSRTVVTAPQAGRITKITAAKGAYAAAGQVLMMLVPRDIWVTANFKETQLDNMRPGQSVAISVDAYPERTFSGRVDSIQAGSGTVFSLLPAENATGNYVKVVQRVPVKIVFDELPDVYLGPGMSVVPSVKVR
ncbi:MAG: HlyD family secretion protein [Bradyrhizobiaceae bacterium]|nr:HlyD family secretion protein [Bradyrhizobiaceae bacterium]